MAILEIELVNGEAIHNGVLYENAIVKVEICSSSSSSISSVANPIHSSHKA